VVYRVSETGIDGGSHNQAPPQQLHYDVNRILVNVKFLYFIHIKVFFFKMKNVHNVFNFPKGVAIFKMSCEF
jgi:hypothetical protein